MGGGQAGDGRAPAISTPPGGTRKFARGARPLHRREGRPGTPPRRRGRRGGWAPRPSAPPGPRPRGGWRAGARGVGRGAGGAGTCSPRAAASPGQPGRGPGRGLRLPPGSAAQRMSPARLWRVYYAAGAGEPKRSRPRGPGGDGRRSRRGQVRLSLASLRARGGGRQRAGRAGQRGPESPAQAAGASGEPGAPASAAAAFVRGHDATKRGGRPGPLSSPSARSLPAGRDPGSGASPRPGRVAWSWHDPRQPASRAPSLTEGIFSPLSSARHLLEGKPGRTRRGRCAARPGPRRALRRHFLGAPRPPRFPAAAGRLALGPSTRPGRGARPGPSPALRGRPELEASGRRGLGQRPPRVRGPAPSWSPFAGSQQPGREETQFPF